MIEPGPSFKDNLQLLPAIDDVARIDFLDATGQVVDTIPHAPGKLGSLAVYRYLQATFGKLDAQAAEHGLAVFAEHVPDAKANPGAHPNVDRLIDIAAGAPALGIEVVAA